MNCLSHFSLDTATTLNRDIYDQILEQQQKVNLPPNVEEVGKHIKIYIYILQYYVLSVCGKVLVTVGLKRWSL